MNTAYTKSGVTKSIVKYRYHLYVLLAGMVWSTLGLFTQLLTDAQVDLFSQVFWRLVIGTIGSVVLALIFKQKMAKTKKEWHLVIINAVIFLLAYTTFPISIYLGTPIAKAIVLVYAYPLTIVPLSYWILGDKVTRRNLLAIGTTLISLAIIFEVWTLENMKISTGEIMALFNSLCASAVVVWGAKIRRETKMGSAAMMANSFILSIPMLFGLGWLMNLMGINLFVPTITVNWGVVWWWLLGLGLLATVAPVGLLYAGSRHVKPNVSGVLMATEPVWTYLWGWLFFGQTLAWTTIIGGVGILLSVLLV